jgi:uncharacterized protein (TIGR02145 family)
MDFSSYPAQQSCKYRGGRLPNNQELQAIYSGRASYGNNFVGFYWTATEYTAYDARYMYFANGYNYYQPKNNTYSVRCVKD